MRAAVIGAGPAGLMAVEALAAGGAQVTLVDRMPSFGRKFLMAGRGGLNLTHTEPAAAFRARYGAAEPRLAPLLDVFDADALRAWALQLGQETFVGSSGRVFPHALKASPLLRAWLARLAAAGVEMRPRTACRGWDAEGRLRLVDATGGETRLAVDATVLALGGASWPRLGSDGGWTAWLDAPLAPFQPANCGFHIAWSEPFAGRFAGAALKPLAMSFEGRTVRGEATVAAYGLEGGAVYALSAPLRDAIARDGTATPMLDLAPDLAVARLTERLARAPASASTASRLRKGAGLSPVAAGLLREAHPKLPREPEKLTQAIKAAPLTFIAPHGLERAISSAGGVRWEAVDARLMLRSRPGVFVAGEMLDWEAATGGYLLQACFATGVAAGRGALEWMAERGLSR